MISEFGKGLKIVISCQGVLEQDWMSYVCWSSIKQNLPDAKISLICKRGDVIFNWPYKVGLKILYYTEKPQIHSEDLSLIEILPTILAVRKYMSDNVGPVDIKSDLFATFVDYSQGFGKLQKLPMGYPMGAGQFRHLECSVNEVRIIKLLENFEKVYKNLGAI